MNRGVLALWVAMLFWGTAFVVTAALVEPFGPFTLAALRFLTALLVIMPAAYRQGFRPGRALKPPWLLFGFTGIALYFGLQNLGLLFTTAVNAALIVSAIPAVTTILSVTYLKERPSRARVVGIVLSVTGALIVSAAGGESGARSAPLLGNLLMLGAVVAWATYTVQSKRLASEHPASWRTAASMSAGLLFLLPLAGVEIGLLGMPHVSWVQIAGVFYLGWAASALTFFLWNYSLRFVDASTAGAYNSLTPVIGFTAGVLLGEPVGWVQLVGGGVALLGVWFNKS